MPAPEIIHQLVAQFTHNREAYRSGKYNEAQLRQEFLNPFFEALGWDMVNRSGYAPQNREVIHEDSIDVEGGSRAPDYCFRLGQTRKFFVEAKKPAVDIQYDIHPAYQLRRYAWNVQLPLSILTDFEEFAVYDCRNKPGPTESAATARVMFIKYTQYVEKWDVIAAIFSREAVWKGSFDQYAADKASKKGTTQVDDAFLQDIEGWRLSLARNIALRNPQVINERQLNYAVQMTIDRLIFLRICEDRGIEPENQLREICKAPGIYASLVNLFQRADLKYNSGLFHFKAEKDETSAADSFTPALSIDDQVLKEIVKSTYYPCPYIFKEIPVEILGQVYEQFLGKVIRLTAGHQAKVEEKPEVRKAGGVYYTPRYIVDYIVANTLGKLLEGKTPESASQLKIVDPACGSGSFLLGAFQHLLDWHLAYYTAHEPEKWAKGKKPALTPAEGGGWKLTSAEKKRILVNNLHGVDIDAQAVEVTKLSLLLKVLEEESGQLSLGLERALPDLGRNIQCGNSLIGWDYFEGQLVPDEKDVERVNPFDWQRAFAPVFARGGFDAVIGNPPYVFARSEGIKKEEKLYFYEKFKHQKFQLNTYAIFIEMAYYILKQCGWFGFIIPNNWLTIGSMLHFRDFIIENTRDLIIVNNKYKVFFGVNVDTSIITFSKDRPNSIKLIESCEIKKYNQISVMTPEELAGKVIIQIHTDNDIKNNGIIDKVMNISTNLGSIATVKAGLKAYETGKGFPPQTDSMKHNRIYHAKTKVDNSYRRYLEGRDVKRYKIEWSGSFLKYGRNLAAPRDPNLFENQRILIRQIPSLPPYSINGVLVNGEELNDINSMIVKDPNAGYIIEYILGILNSRLITFWFDHHFGKFQRKIFPQFKVNELAVFPIRTIDFNDPADVKKHGQMVTLVERMLELHQRSPLTPQEQERLAQQMAATDAQIDRLVYDLYGLTEDEIKVVEGT